MLNEKTIDAATLNLMKWFRKSPLWEERLDEIIREMEHAHFRLASLSEFEDVQQAFKNIFDKFTHTKFTWHQMVLEQFFVTQFGEYGESNVIDAYIGTHGKRESAAGRLWLEGFRRSNVSLFEIVRIDRGKIITLKDMILDDATVTIHSFNKFDSVAIWDCVVARIVTVKGKNYWTDTILPFEHKFAKKIAAQLEIHFKHSKRRTKKENRKRKREGLSELPIDRKSLYQKLNLVELYLGAWITQCITQNLTPPPTVRNSDGEKLVSCEICFPVAGRLNDLTAKLYETAGFEQYDTESEWAWFGAGSPSERTAKQGKIDLDAEVYPDSVEGDFTVTKLGEITLHNGILILDTNSEERAKRGASYLSASMGNLLGSPSEIRHTDKSFSIHSIQETSEARIEIPQNMKTKEAHACLDRHYQLVIDNPLSTFGGKTPRQAAKSKLMREQVVDWLKLLENDEYRRSQKSSQKIYNTDWLWIELNLERPT